MLRVPTGGLTCAWHTTDGTLRGKRGGRSAATEQVPSASASCPRAEGGRKLDPNLSASAGLAEPRPPASCRGPISSAEGDIT